MIEVTNVSFRYPDAAHDAVREASIHVAPGELVGIVGPNGSGKSTLGRLMKGLLLPSHGTVSVDGLDTREHSLAVRQIVGLVFQNPNSQIVNAVVEQEVAFGPENLALPSQEIRERVETALHAVGLQGRETAECHALSMADKQRVALAAVTAMEPRYLILDEPTTWIEPSQRWPLLRTVLTWAHGREAGLVLVTHRMDEAQVCDRVYGMLEGKVLAEGSPGEILRSEQLRSRLALDVPDTITLTERLHDAGLPVEPGSPLDALADALSRP